MIQDRFAVHKVESVTGTAHSLPHDGRDRAKIDQSKKIETDIVECLGGLLAQMKSRKENGSPLLDSPSILFGGNLGNANARHARTVYGWQGVRNRLA